MSDMEMLRDKLKSFDWFRPMSVEDSSQFQRWLREKEELMDEVASSLSDEEIQELWDSQELMDFGDGKPFHPWGDPPMGSGSSQSMDPIMEKALKRLIRETYEAACMECGYEEGINEEEALEAYLAEAKKSMRLGGGGRFAKFVKKLKDQGKSEESAKAIAAAAGRKKYGKAKMAQWASAGKKKKTGF